MSQTDSEYSDSSDSSDSTDSSDSAENSIYFEGEEISRTKYNMVLCELFHKSFHGEPYDDIIQFHYFVSWRFKIMNLAKINNIIHFLNEEYLQLVNSNHPFVNNHSIYKNYKNILSSPNYIKLEIAQCIYYETHCVAILKTFWIRLIQRKWKSIFKNIKEILLKRCQLSALKHKQNTGRWPNDCFNVPSLKGMLYQLKN